MSGKPFFCKRSNQEQHVKEREWDMLEDYTVLDLETTGLDPKKEKIIEIGAARIRGGKVAATYRTMLQPGRELPSRITELTGITPQMLQGQPYIEEVLPAFMEFLGDDVLMGHRVLFDYSFAKRAAVNAGLPFEKRGVDTLKLARICLPELPSKRLSDLCVRFGIVSHAHRALNDALAAHELYQRLCAGFRQAADCEPEPLHYAVKKEGPITPAQKQRLKRMEAYYRITLPYEIDRLTKNEASRIMDKLVLTYGKPHRENAE